MQSPFKTTTTLAALAALAFITLTLFLSPTTPLAAQSPEQTNLPSDPFTAGRYLLVTTFHPQGPEYLAIRILETRRSSDWMRVRIWNRRGNTTQLTNEDTWINPNHFANTAWELTDWRP